jgi:hypothetical protein
MCVVTATWTGVGPDQATGDGALYSRFDQYSIRGGTPGTVAVKKGFLGLSTKDLRQWGTQIYVMPADDGAIANNMGSPGLYTVSDYGDRSLQNDSGDRFDLYRFPTNRAALSFGRRTMTTTIVFPAASGGQCPAGTEQ